MKVNPSIDSISLNKNMITEFFEFVNKAFPLYVEITTNLKRLLVVTRMTYFLLGLLVGMDDFDYVSKRTVLFIFISAAILEMFGTIKIFLLNRNLMKTVKGYRIDPDQNN